MTRLRRQLREMEGTRATQRASRQRAGIPGVAIAGYTNAGKSSLLNAMTHAGVLVENALFATLDPTVRKTRTPHGREYTLADTVGFVRHLPHELVEAFRSTLEEVRDADLILHVVDGSDEAPEDQISAVREVLAEIGAQDVPELVVINKADLAESDTLARLLRREPHAVVVSARTGAGLSELAEAIELDLPGAWVEINVLVPYTRGDLLSRAHREGEVLSEEHGDMGTQLKALVPPALAGQLQVRSYD